MTQINSTLDVCNSKSRYLCYRYQLEELHLFGNDGGHKAKSEKEVLELVPQMLESAGL